jgi:tRNA threonylcarbamoyladenosine modification (KEOPS) complex  Pcc1 subunit
MTAEELGWTARISVRLPRVELATWVERTLGPEASREVPRARATIERAAPNIVEVAITARDTGAVRAAMNTYLGWVHLALDTVGRADRTEHSLPEKHP